MGISATLARTAACIVVCATPALLGAGPARQPIEKTWSPSAERLTGKIDAAVGTLVELRFPDPETFDDVVAGRIPVSIAARVPGSESRAVLDPAVLARLAGADRSKVTLYVVTASPPGLAWDASGCVDTRTSAAAAGNGLAITLSHAPCADAALQRSKPVPGLGPTIRWNPPPRSLSVVTGSSSVGAAGTVDGKLENLRTRNALVVRTR